MFITLGDLHWNDFFKKIKLGSHCIAETATELGSERLTHLPQVTQLLGGDEAWEQGRVDVITVCVSVGQWRMECGSKYFVFSRSPLVDGGGGGAVGKP